MAWSMDWRCAFTILNCKLSVDANEDQLAGTEGRELFKCDSSGLHRGHSLITNRNTRVVGALIKSENLLEYHFALN